MGISVTVLGCRGSMATGARDTALFGGDTSCYEVRAGTDLLYLDAGSGLLRAKPGEAKDIHLFISHPHLDHIMGFAMFPALARRDCRIHVYGFKREGMGPEEQMRRLFAPPLWPVWPGDAPAEVCFHTLREPVKAAGFEVDWIPSCHSGGSAVYRLRREGKTLVYATDFEHGNAAEEALIRFAAGADLLLYDGQYTPEEHARRKGYGHSTGEEGLRIAKICGAKRLWLVHHDPWAEDEVLLGREKRLGIHYARQGETAEL